VEVARVLDLREGVELGPAEGGRMLDQPVDGERPLAERDVRLDPEVQDGKSARELLTGRQAVGRGDRAGPDPARLLLLGPPLLGRDVAVLGHRPSILE